MLVGLNLRNRFPKHACDIAAIYFVNDHEELLVTSL